MSLPKVSDAAFKNFLTKSKKKGWDLGAFRRMLSKENPWIEEFLDANMKKWREELETDPEHAASYLLYAIFGVYELLKEQSKIDESKK